MRIIAETETRSGRQPVRLRRGELHGIVRRDESSAVVLVETFGRGAQFVTGIVYHHDGDAPRGESECEWVDGCYHSAHGVARLCQAARSLGLRCGEVVLSASGQVAVAADRCHYGFTEAR